MSRGSCGKIGGNAAFTLAAYIGKGQARSRAAKKIRFALDAKAHKFRRLATALRSELYPFDGGALQFQRPPGDPDQADGRGRDQNDAAGPAKRIRDAAGERHRG